MITEEIGVHLDLGLILSSSYGKPHLPRRSRKYLSRRCHGALAHYSAAVAKNRKTIGWRRLEHASSPSYTKVHSAHCFNLLNTSILQFDERTLAYGNIFEVVAEYERYVVYQVTDPTLNAWNFVFPDPPRRKA